MVVPAYNEEKLISRVVETMPHFVDKIIIVNDKSRDSTGEVIDALALQNEKIKPIHHTKNSGVGGAIASGYKWACDNNFDVAVVMAGDAQMDPNDLLNIIEPVVNGEVDYSKGNRLFTGEAYKKIPKLRYFGNSVLSFFTKEDPGCYLSDEEIA